MSEVSRVKPTVLGEGVDQQGRLYIIFEVAGARTAVAYEHISETGKVWSILLQKGCRIFQGSSRRALLKKLEEKNIAGPTFKVASSVGWQFGVFVLPNRVIGRPPPDLVVALDHLPQGMVSKYREGGTLEDWQREVVSLCNGNTRLIFALCWLLASPVAALIPEAIKTGGAQIYGGAESGKTASAIGASTSWGCHLAHGSEKGFCEDWNTTLERIEDTISAHSDVGLPLDETKLSARVVDTIWRLAEGSWKQRKNEESTSGFRGFFLSTSNDPLWQLAREEGRDVDGAVLTRLLDIPLPRHANGLFEELNGFENGRALAEALKVRSRTYFGTSGPVFIERLIADRDSDPDEWQRYIRARRSAYLNALEKRAKRRGLVVSARAADRMATTYATGRLAAKYGILPWKRRQILNALLSCHLDALRQVQPILNKAGERPPALAVSPKKGLVVYLRQELSRFIDLDRHSGALTVKQFDAAAGFVETTKGKRWIYLTYSRFKRAVGSSKVAKSLLAELTDAGFVQHNTGDSTAQRRIGGKMRRVVVIRRKLIDVEA